MSERSPQGSSSWNPQKRGQACAAAAMVFVAVLASMGCLNLQFGGRSSPPEDPSVLAQNNTIRVPKGQTIDVYYPVPYASTPNLVLEDAWHAYEIIEQKADHFRVRNNTANDGAAVTWTARGVRPAPQTAAPQPATITTTATTQP